MLVSGHWENLGVDVAVSTGDSSKARVSSLGGSC